MAEVGSASLRALPLGGAQRMRPLRVRARARRCSLQLGHQWPAKPPPMRGHAAGRQTHRVGANGTGRACVHGCVLSDRRRLQLRECGLDVATERQLDIDDRLRRCRWRWRCPHAKTNANAVQIDHLDLPQCLTLIRRTTRNVRRTNPLGGLSAMHQAHSSGAAPDDSRSQRCRSPVSAWMLSRLV